MDYSCLKDLVSNKKWRDRVARKLKEDDLSPLDIAIVTKADLPTVKGFYQESKAISGDILGFACTFGASPGVIPFLVEQAPEAANYEGCWLDDEDCYFTPLFAAMDPLKPDSCSTISEDDIRALIDAYPEASIRHMNRYYNDEEHYYYPLGL